MRKHRIAEVVAILILVMALVYLVVGLFGAGTIGRNGLGTGWGPGWTGWVSIPMAVTTVLSAVTLMVFGVVLLFLTKIDTNLALARQRREEARQSTAASRAAEAAAVAVVAEQVVAEPVAEPAVTEEPAPDTSGLAAAEAGAGAAGAAAAGAVLLGAAALAADDAESKAEAVEAEVEAAQVAAAVVAADAVKRAAEEPEAETPVVDAEAEAAAAAEASAATEVATAAGVAAAAEAARAEGETLPEDMPPVEIPPVDIETAVAETPAVVPLAVETPDYELQEPPPSRTDVADTLADTSAASADQPADILGDLPPVEMPPARAGAPQVDIVDETPPATADDQEVLRAQIAELQAKLAGAQGGTEASPSAEFEAGSVADVDAAADVTTGSTLPGTDEVARVAAANRAAEQSRGAASQPDDLLQIQGVGPFYVQRLKDAGITTYEGLAATSDETLARVTGTFVDRVQREDWRGQAKRLAVSK